MGRREREYTPEEAMAITLREVTPHWYRSPPLVVGVNLNDRSYPQPLDSKMLSGTWVLFFVSATSPAFDKMLQIQRLWEKRYSGLGIQFILSFRGFYPYFKERKAVENWVSTLPIRGSVYCDMTGALSKSFSAEGEPGISIMSEGKVIYSSSGALSPAEAEKSLQLSIRESSPGIPFWPPLQDEEKNLSSTDRWMLFDKSKPILNQQIEIVGKWELLEDRMITNDSKAELHFRSPGSSVDIVARSLSDSGDPTRVRIDSNGASFSDAFSGADLVTDDEGNSSVLLSGPRAYRLLRNLPDTMRTLRIRFPFAKISPVAVYGFEFGDKITSRDL